MLYSFTPVSAQAGSWQNRTYFFPPVKEDADKRIVHVNRQQNVYTELEEADGVYLSSGAEPIWAAFGEIQASFVFHPAWLLNNGNTINYGATFAGMEKAIQDFILAVVMGGLGTLVDKHQGGDAPWCSAVINGDYTVSRTVGAPVAQIDVVFLVPSGKWTLGGTTYRIS